eukprot:g6461.t1
MRERGQDLRSRIQDKVAESKSIAQVFNSFDLDRNGVLDHAEFAKGLEKLGFSCKDSEMRGLLKWVDPGDTQAVPYASFAKAMAEIEDLGAARRGSALRHYTRGLRDNLGASLGVKEDAYAIGFGTVGAGDGPMAGEHRIQRDVGDRASIGDLRMNTEAHHALRANEQVFRKNSHHHTVDDHGLSLFEKSLRTPRYTKMDKTLATLRVSSPGLSGVLAKNQYGEQAHVDFTDPYGLKTVVEPMTHRSTASFAAEASYTGGVRPCETRSELFAKRRGEKFRELSQLKPPEPFHGFSAKRVYHFVKDKPGESKQRMGDIRFDPRTGVDLVAFERKALAKHANNASKEAQRRFDEALVGRGN